MTQLKDDHFAKGVERGIEFAVDQMVGVMVSLKHHGNICGIAKEFLMQEFVKFEKEMEGYNGN